MATLLTDIVAPSSVVILNGTQTLTNKTLTSPTINTPTLNNAVLTGTLTANGSVGTNGQVLASTGSGLQWVTKDVSTLDSLSDVIISDAAPNQVLTYTGSAWINADPNTTVASAVFASGATSDLGYVTDLVIDLSEDLGAVDEIYDLSYDMGALSISGVVSLSNLDQSVKADYIGYSIIFGF
jgi:hypothetical protein